MIEPMEYKIALTIIAIVLTIVGYAPYLLNTLKGSTKPHAFSWLLFSVLAAIAFFAQVSEGGGAGVWLMGFSSLICLVVFLFALIKGSRKFDRLDWMLLGGAFVAITLWLITSDPLLSVILASFIEVVAFMPALRKGYNKPHEETLFTYFINAVRFGLGLIALEAFTVTAILFSVTVIAVNLVFIVILFARRKMLSHTP